MRGLLTAEASRSAAGALGLQAPTVVAHVLRCSAACGMFPQQGLNPCPLHWQADSYPLHHQGSPSLGGGGGKLFFNKFC